MVMDQFLFATKDVSRAPHLVGFESRRAVLSNSYFRLFYRLAASIAMDNYSSISMKKCFRTTIVKNDNDLEVSSQETELTSVKTQYHELPNEYTYISRNRVSLQ